MSMKTLEEYDARLDEIRLRILERDMYVANIRSKAEQAALSTHPVVPYVLNLPVQSPLYPASRYLKFANPVRDEDGEPVCKHGDPLLITPTGEVMTRSQVVSNLGRKLSNYITWAMPGSDKERPGRCKCGFIHASDRSIVYTTCPDNQDHHLKAKAKHCWSLRCPRCMNDTALRKAVAVEKRMLLYAELLKKEGRKVPLVSHWTVSPPQEFMKSAMQTFEAYDSVCNYIESELAKCGAQAGFNVFHPWRQNKKDGRDYWELSPHFHCILYGYIDTDRFRNDNPGWVIKKIHARQRIKSIRHTVAYLFTHMGVGYVDIEPEDVDWDLDFLDYMIPGLKSPGATYRDKDFEDQELGIGRMCGDLDGFDWEQWTMDRLFKDLRTRYWGGVARRNIVNVDMYRQYKMRVCKECGNLLRTFDGFSDHMGQYVRYIADHAIVCFAHNADVVRSFYLKYKSDLPEGMTTVLDLVKRIPLAVCAAELPIELENHDLFILSPL